MSTFETDASDVLGKTSNEHSQTFSTYLIKLNTDSASELAFDFIEGKELDNFLREFVSSVNATDVGPEVVSDSMLAELKECFMEAYDDNKDGKIEIRELAQLLPLEESFLLLFRFDTENFPT